MGLNKHAEKSLAALLFWLALCPSPSWAAEREAALAQRGYEDRFAAVQELGQAYPGFKARISSELQELGVWGGILLQTRWQERTHRSELNQWRYLNTTLTLAPLQYLHEYQARPDMNCSESEYAQANPVRDMGNAPVSQHDVCNAWLNYFRTADHYQKNPPSLVHRVSSHIELLKRLWHAHTSALQYALWQYQDEIASQPIPQDEARFFKGWLRLVDSIASLHFWTQDSVDDPMLSGTLPQCAPLGSPDCQVSALPLETRIFVKSMMSLAP